MYVSGVQRRCDDLQAFDYKAFLSFILTPNALLFVYHYTNTVVRIFYHSVDNYCLFSRGVTVMPEHNDTENKDVENERKSRIKNATNLDIPNIYFNGFVVSTGLGDFLISLEKNGKPVAILNASYTVSKTLIEKLGGVLNTLEEKTKNKIMTIDDIEKSLITKATIDEEESE